MGIDVALNPLDMTASHVLRFIQGSKRVISSQLIQGQAEMIEIIADDHMRLTNRPIEDLDLPDGVMIAAIHRGTDAIIPEGSTEILKDDRVIIICLLSEVPNLEKFIRSGRTGFFK
jgi:trk system potassium uptake protein TrkA